MASIGGGCTRDGGLALAYTAVVPVTGNWLATVKYLVEEHGANVNSRDLAAATPLHNAAARGDNELIMYLVSKGGDVMAVDAVMVNGRVCMLVGALEHPLA